MECANYLQTQPYIYDIKKIDLAIWNFEGKAFSWISELLIDDILAMNWKQFCEMVCSRFDREVSNNKDVEVVGIEVADKSLAAQRKNEVSVHSFQVVVGEEIEIVMDMLPFLRLGYVYDNVIGIAAVKKLEEHGNLLKSWDPGDSVVVANSSLREIINAYVGSDYLCFPPCGVSYGFDNPIFAAMELDYSEADEDPPGQAANGAQKHLTFYELDLGLNHVSREWSEQVDNGAIMLVTIPGGGDGPSGMLLYDKLEEKALDFRPKILICGGSSYPREWEYPRLRKIADKCGVLLLCDMAQISGLIAAKECTSPYDFCDIITSTTHSSLIATNMDANLLAVAEIYAVCNEEVLASEKVHARFLLRPLFSLYSSSIKLGESSLLIVFEMLGNLVGSMDRSYVSAYHANVFELCRLALDLRHQNQDEYKQLDKSLKAEAMNRCELEQKFSDLIQVATEEDEGQNHLAKGVLGEASASEEVNRIGKEKMRGAIPMVDFHEIYASEGLIATYLNVAEKSDKEGAECEEGSEDIQLKSLSCPNESDTTATTRAVTKVDEFNSQNVANLARAFDSIQHSVLELFAELSKRASSSIPVYIVFRCSYGRKEGMQQQQRLKQQQQQLALMQQSLYHPGLLAPPQIEPILSGNWPPGIDSTTCRSVYVGNIHPPITEPLLQEVFSGIGPLEGCKLIWKEKSSYGFIDYFDRRSTALTIWYLNGRHLFGKPIKINWAYASAQREDTSNHFNIFVGDLSPEVTDATLFAYFSAFSTCSDARVIWDQKTGYSRGFGFVSYCNQQDDQHSINDSNGKGLGSRQIRCKWAAKGVGQLDEHVHHIGSTFSSFDPQGRGSFSGGDSVMALYGVNYGGDDVKQKGSTLVEIGIDLVKSVKKGLKYIGRKYSSFDPRGRGSYQRRGIVMTQREEYSGVLGCGGRLDYDLRWCRQMVKRRNDLSLICGSD